MSFQFYCDKCYADLSADENMQGKTLECPNCENKVRVSENSSTIKTKKSSQSYKFSILFIIVGVTLNILYLDTKFDDEFGNDPLISIFLAGVVGAIAGIIGFCVDFVFDCFKKD